MRIVVLGVGRSGTSALFNLLQDMCVDEFDNKVDFVYEPFLWNRKVFNKVYSEYKNEFSLSSSLSIDGMYNNKHIPQFVDKNNLAKFEHNKFLNDLARPMKGMDCLLAKYIRGNGRYLLLKKICPDCKFIFMMRNPLDTLNSSINMFSFLGDDFYESDWEMLANEIYDKYNDQVHDQFKTRLSKELAYWFYMNKFLLENSVGDDILKICYEDYIQNKRQYLKNICSFLNIEFKDSYYQRSLDSVGPIFSGKVNLDKRDYETILPFLAKYEYFVATYMQGVALNLEKVQSKYSGKLLDKREKCIFNGKNTLYLRNSMRSAVRAKTKKTLKSKVRNFIHRE